MNALRRPAIRPIVASRTRNSASDALHRAAHERAWSIPLAQLNPADPQLFVDDTVGYTFDRLREEAPVQLCHSPIAGEGDYWSVTRYQDIMQVDTQPAIFSSDWRLGGIWLMNAPSEDRIPMFIAMDPPQHDAQRKLVSPIVAPANLKHWQDQMRTRTARLLDGLPRNQTFDFVEQVSIELTTCMLATLFDFPFEDRRMLAWWSDVATFSHAASPDAMDVETRMVEMGKMLAYFTWLWNERVNLPPRRDLVSMLAHGAATRHMSPIEYLGHLVLLTVGGFDTTHNAMTGGLLALHEHPEQYAKLRANPALVDSLVPEILRWQTPVAYVRRTARADTTLAGQAIRRGDKVAMWFLSGNRDELAIERPDEFIIDRARPRQHLSFGFGIHRCVGNRLAELQLKILWEEILRRCPEIEVVGEPQRARSNFVRGFSRLLARIPD